jgi:hypothetical protein
MCTNPKQNSQRGQAMTEFVAAMALFIPLIMGVIYVFKYGDIKHQAIQASRYAAMERALDPRGHESIANRVVENATVARFFRDGARHPIARDEQAQGATAGDENPNWGQLNGDAMISQYADIQVNIAAKSIHSNALAPVDTAIDKLHEFSGLPTGYGVEARVEVPVANIAHFKPLQAINLKIGATTVIAGDPWGSAGAADVADHMTIVSVPARAIRLLNKIPGIDILFRFLTDTPAPQFGCVKPDVVPEHVAPGAQYDPQDDPSNPANVNDKCY